MILLPDVSSLGDSETYRYLNIYAVHELIPKTFRLVLQWGQKIQKDPQEDYYKYLSRVCSRKIMRECFNTCDENQLGYASDTSGFDATLLFKLIQVTCVKLKPRKDPVWCQSGDDQMECLLYKLKCLRNSVCHDISSGSTCPQLFTNICACLIKICKMAGDFYNIDTQTVQNSIDTLNDEINCIGQTKEEQRRMKNLYYFRIEGHQESKSHWERHCTTDVVLFSGETMLRDQVFHPLEISIRTVSYSADPRMEQEVMPYSRIVDPWTNTDECSITIVQGEAGSGKTTLSKNIAQQFFQISKREMDSLQRFDMIHFLECRNRNFGSLEEFIKKTYPNTCFKLGVDDTVDCLSFVSNLLFIDGYDEHNRSSIAVIKDIFDRMKVMPNYHLVITTRPHALPELSQMLKLEGFEYRVCELMPITQEERKIEFLSRYYKARHSGHEMSKNIITSFKNLNPIVKENFFTSPINLVMFYYLYTSVSAKELTTVADVTVQIFHQYETVLRRKLENEGIANLKQLIQDILDQVALYSFETLAKNLISLCEKDIDEIISRCTKTLKSYEALGSLDVNQILSVIFISKTSPTPEFQMNYQYFHKSIQEMFASRILLKYLREKNTKTVRSVFASILKNDSFNEKLDYATIRK